MEIEKIERIILTQEEKAILSKAHDILDEIYDKCENDGDIENYADEARDDLKFLLENAKVEGGKPHGAVKVTIIM